MFGWLRGAPACPIDPAPRQWLDGRWDWLEAQFGRGRVAGGPLIMPNAEFFPDPYAGTFEDAQALMARVAGYMGLDAGTVELSIYEQHRPPLAEDWSHAAGLYGQGAGRFHVAVEAGNLADPLALVATLAHELGHVHLLGHGRVPPDAEDHEPLTDLLTVFLGLGLFSANAAVRESNWTFGQYSGWSASRQGYLDLRQYGYAFARYARSRGEDGSAWARELRLDVRTSFKQSMRLLAAEATGSGG